MTNKTIDEVVSEFKNEYGIYLTKIRRKKIIFDGHEKNSKSIVVVIPESKIYPRGHGWVDFTKIQIDMFRRYSIAIGVFRMSDGKTYYINLKDLFPLLTDDNMMENKKEGLHWKLDIWPTKIVIRNGGHTLYIKENTISDMSELL